MDCFLKLSDFGGCFEGLFAGFDTLLLELFQLGFGFFEGAVEAMLVEREAEEEITMPLEGSGLGEAAIDEGVGRYFGGLFVKGFAGGVVSVEAEETVLHGADAVEAPVGVGDGLDAFGFDQTLRF